MNESNAPVPGEHDAIREWLASYEPQLLSPSQRTHLLPDLRDLVIAADFTSLTSARTAMSRAVRFIADMASPEVTELDRLLTELNIAAWTHGGVGREPCSAAEASSVRLLLRARDGLTPVSSATTSRATRLPFTLEELVVLAGLTTGSEADARMLVAVVGAGLSGPDTTGASIEIVDGVARVVLRAGAVREVDSTLIGLLPQLSDGPVCMNNWRKFARWARCAGVELTQYRARDSWAARILSEPRPSVEVIRSLGIHCETIAAVAPLLELPGRVELRAMLRDQRRGDWPADTAVHGALQSATSSADVEVNAMATRRPSRAEMKRRVQAARSAAAQPPTLAPGLVQILDGYEPDNCDAVTWEAVRPVVRDVMERSGTRGAPAFRKQLGVLVVYLRWRHSEGLDLTPTASMTFTAIDDFYRRVGDGFRKTTRNDYRSRLRLLAQSVNPGVDAPPTVTLGHRPVRPAYSEADAAAIRRVALRQRRPHIRRQLCLIVGLAMGAGLASSDLRHLRTQHVIDEGDDGIRVEVPGDRPRTVWVRVDYEELVRVGLEGVQPGHLLIGKKADRKKVTGTVLEQADLYDFADLDVARMRTTWMSWLMTQPVPLVVVMHAAGLETARTLTDLAQQLPVSQFGADDLRGTPS